MSASPHRVLRSAAVLAVSAAVTTSVAVAVTGDARAESASLSPTGSVIVTLRGNGHGHGMSQYGAQGAAVRGLKYTQILGFYYPGTTIKALPASTIRVKLSGFPSSLTVAAYRKLAVTGVTGALPTAGVKKYRLTPSGTGFALQQLAAAPGSRWRTIKAGLPNRSEFRRAGKGSVRLYRADGSSNRYLGAVRGIRSGAGAYSVNRVSLDNYTAGVVPSEMPTSWRAEAVNSQAVAARSYGRFAVENEHKRNYDICDTTMCQVYSGRAVYNRSGHVVARDYQRAAKATSNRVLQYRGKTVFAQFSASNGGYVSDGGKPYLRAKADPYDAGAPGNPYLNYTRRVSVRSLASEYGLAKVTGIAINRRDGGGAWGGRVTSAYLTGTNAQGKSMRVSMTGDSLQWAFGAGTTLFTVRRG